MTKLGILGASGHGTVVAEAALQGPWSNVAFFDDAWPDISQIGEWSVDGSSKDLGARSSEFDAFIVAIGDNETRVSRQKQFAATDFIAAIVIHPRADVSPRSDIRPGCVVLSGAVIGPGSSLGEACIVNSCASVDHDCDLRDGVHISPGAHLGGNVTVGSKSWIGIGATVKNGVVIGSNVIVGAGAAVVKNIDNNCTVIGVPARPIDNKGDE